MTEQGQLHTEDLVARRPGATGDGEQTTAQGEATDAQSGGQTWPAPGTERSEASDEGWAALLGDTREFASRWDAIQAGFVDEPRRAVEEADALVARVIQRLADSFSSERSRLEAQWSRGDQVGTEDLRVALRRYRSFFNQLLMRADQRV